MYYSLQSVTHPTIAKVRELWLIYHRPMVPVNQPSEQCLERLEEAVFQVSEQLASMGTCRSKPAQYFRCRQPKHLAWNWRSMPARDTLSAPSSDMLTSCMVSVGNQLSGARNLVVKPYSLKQFYSGMPQSLGNIAQGCLKLDKFPMTPGTYSLSEVGECRWQATNFCGTSYHDTKSTWPHHPSYICGYRMPISACHWFLGCDFRWSMHGLIIDFEKDISQKRAPNQGRQAESEGDKLLHAGIGWRLPTKCNSSGLHLWNRRKYEFRTTWDNIWQPA